MEDGPDRGDPVYEEPSEAGNLLVLGFAGVFIFPPLAPFVWAKAVRELRAIDAGRRDPTNRGTARVGRLLGVLGTTILVLWVGFYLFIVIGA